MNKRLEELRQKFFARMKSRNQSGVSSFDIGQIMERVKAIDQELIELSPEVSGEAKRQLLQDERTELMEIMEMVELTIEQGKGREEQ